MRGKKSFPKGTFVVHMLHCSMDTKEEASMMWASWQYHSEGGGQEGGRKGPVSSSPGTHPHLGFSGRILQRVVYPTSHLTQGGEGSRASITERRAFPNKPPQSHSSMFCHRLRKRFCLTLICVESKGML